MARKHLARPQYTHAQTEQPSSSFQRPQKKGRAAAAAAPALPPVDTPCSLTGGVRHESVVLPFGKKPRSERRNADRSKCCGSVRTTANPSKCCGSVRTLEPPAKGCPPAVIRGAKSSHQDPFPIVDRAWDWLSISVPMDTAHALEAATVEDEHGFPVTRKGFTAGQARLCMGGECRRYWDPRVESKQYGRDFEGWEWAGGIARWAAGWLRGREGRPSRIDVQWTYSVPPDFTADTWAISADQHAARIGTTVGVTGHAGVNTRYIGGRTADLRIRCYRKDLRDSAWMFEHGPSLRVELTLKRATARAFWQLHQDNPESAFDAAAGHVLRMTGFRPQAAIGPRPQCEPSPTADAAQMLLQWLDQNGERLNMLADAGVNLFDLAGRRADTLSRAALARSAKLRRRFERVDWTRVEDIVRADLNARRTRIEVQA